PRATPPSASVVTVPDLSAEGGGTQLLPGAAARAKAPPSRPGMAAKSARPPMRPDGAGDTLVDTDGGGPPGTFADDLPGGTAMLKPGQVLPPPVRRAPSRVADPPVERTEELSPAEAGGRTELFGGAPARSPARRGPPASGKQASTNIMTPEESEAAQRQAQAKLEEAKKAVVHTRT